MEAVKGALKETLLPECLEMNVHAFEIGMEEMRRLLSRSQAPLRATTLPRA